LIKKFKFDNTAQNKLYPRQWDSVIKQKKKNLITKNMTSNFLKCYL